MSEAAFSIASDNEESRELMRKDEAYAAEEDEQSA